MDLAPLVIATICYLWQAMILIGRGEYPFALCYFFYASANLCLLAATKRALTAP